MNAVVFTFTTISKKSMIPSARIARFISRTLDIPLINDASIKDTRWDVMFIVNGAFSYCAVRDDLAVAVRRAKRIIWVQNDYMIYAPIPYGQAESTFRKAFRVRREKGLPDMDHWTTVEAKAALTKSSRYVNWNALTALKSPLDVDRKAEDDLFYYGSFRPGRSATFDRYFKSQKMALSLSSASNKFAERYPHAEIVTVIPRGGFYRELNRHGLGLYIEDPRSHREFHSPANRFYEMLSAGLPMVFEPEASSMLDYAGYDIRPYIVRNQKDARRLLSHRREIAKEQYSIWWDDFRSLLTHRLLKTYRRYVKEHF